MTGTHATPRSARQRRCGRGRSSTNADRTSASISRAASRPNCAPSAGTPRSSPSPPPRLARTPIVDPTGEPRGRSRQRCVAVDRLSDLDRAGERIGGRSSGSQEPCEQPPAVLIGFIAPRCGQPRKWLSPRRSPQTPFVATTNDLPNRSRLPATGSRKNGSVMPSTPHGAGRIDGVRLGARRRQTPAQSRCTWANETASGSLSLRSPARAS